MALGEGMTLIGVAIKGIFSKEICECLSKKLIDKMKMTPAHAAIVYPYPIEGKGGEGYTYLQPFTESFLAIDVYESFKGAYVIICACKKFNKKYIIKLLEEEGYSIVDSKKSYLRLSHGL